MLSPARSKDINFEKYASDLEAKYGVSYSLFKLTINPEEDFLTNCITFFDSFNIVINCYELLSPAKYAGTWSVKVSIDNPGAVRALGRKISYRPYAHIASYESAMRKALDNGFEVIEKLKTKKRLPEKRRRGKAT